MRKPKLRIFLGVLLLAVCGALGQMAPRETVTVELKGQEIAIEYGRPSLNGRTFEALAASLPPDRMWRAGSEQVTTLTSAADFVIGGERVLAGKYSR